MLVTFFIFTFSKLKLITFIILNIITRVYVLFCNLKNKIVHASVQ